MLELVGIEPKVLKLSGGCSTAFKSEAMNLFRERSEEFVRQNLRPLFFRYQILVSTEVASMGVHSSGLNLGVSLGENTREVLGLNSFSRYSYVLLEDASRVRESRKGPRLQGRLHHLP